MIAYVFWHHRRPEIAAPEYESALRSFHQSLVSPPPPGLERTMVFRVPEVPWMAAATPVYEEWHWLGDSGALDVLNDAAVSGSRTAPHHRVAAMAADGTAGLYSLRLGTPSASPPAVAHWLSKPEGMKYADFFDSLRPHCDDGAALWGRQMALGPAREFCLHAAHEVSLPHPALPIRLAPVFSS